MNQPTNQRLFIHSTYLEALKKLSSREVEVLEGVAVGRTSKEIGRQINISYRTVQKYRENICKKLGIEGNRALFNWCLENINSGE